MNGFFHNEVAPAKVAEICRRHRIRRLALFGSVLRDDFGADSDIDVLVDFEPETRYGLFELARLQLELKEMLGRDVDLIEQRAIEKSRNYIRRKAILSAAETVYASR